MAQAYWAKRWWFDLSSRWGKDHWLWDFEPGVQENASESIREGTGEETVIWDSSLGAVGYVTCEHKIVLYKVEHPTVQKTIKNVGLNLRSVDGIAFQEIAKDKKILLLWGKDYRQGTLENLAFSFSSFRSYTVHHPELVGMYASNSLK